MEWLVGGLILIVSWFFSIFLSHRKYKKDLQQIKRLKALIRPHPVIYEPTITSRIGVSLVSNGGKLEFCFRFIDNYDQEVIDEKNVVEYALTRSFYKITDDPSEIDMIAEVVAIKKSMIGKRGSGAYVC